MGRLDGRTLSTIRKVVETFGLSLDVTVHGLGADADRVRDERHANVLGACATWLRGLGWDAISEVSYSEWGERGSIDLLAWHVSTATLLVVEVKTELASVEETLRKHDEKTRLAPKIARSHGWRPAQTGRLLVFPEDRTQRRRVAAHESVIRGAYPMRSHQAKAWCRAPNGSTSGLLFLTIPPPPAVWLFEGLDSEFECRGRRVPRSIERRRAAWLVRSPRSARKSNHTVALDGICQIPAGH